MSTIADVLKQFRMDILEAEDYLWRQKRKGFEKTTVDYNRLIKAAEDRAFKSLEKIAKQGNTK